MHFRVLSLNQAGIDYKFAIVYRQGWIISLLLYTVNSPHTHCTLQSGLFVHCFYFSQVLALRPAINSYLAL